MDLTEKYLTEAETIGDLQKRLKIQKGIKKEYNKQIKKTPAQMKGKISGFKKSVASAEKNIKKLELKLEKARADKKAGKKPKQKSDMQRYRNK